MTAFTDLVSVADLKSLIASSACRVIDCRFSLMQPDRGRQEYAEGHLPGAVYAHMDEDLASPITAESGRHPLPDVDTFARRLGDWGVDNDLQVVVYDHGNGSVAARLWWLLNWVGHEKVAVLDGGIAAWTAAGETLSTVVPEIVPASFAAEPNANMVATTKEIAATVVAGKPLNLVDVRDKVRFEGEMEPIDAIAGHIPGALNLPFIECVNQDGTWRDADELRRIWNEVLSDRPQAPLIAMCGSGVTACHLLLSARLMGLPLPRLYVGSWSEWIRDAERPVASKKQVVGDRS